MPRMRLSSSRSLVEFDSNQLVAAPIGKFRSKQIVDIKLSERLRVVDGIEILCTRPNEKANEMRRKTALNSI